MINTKTLNFITKTVGAGGIGMVLYDTHVAGKIRASAYEKNHKAGSLSETAMEDLKLDSPSVIKSHVKKGIFHYKMDENLSGFFTAISGYFKGAGTMLVGNVIPLTLSVGTFVGKGIFSKLCGAGLLAYGGIFLLQEGFGIGKSKH